MSPDPRTRIAGLPRRVFVAAVALGALVLVVVAFATSDRYGTLVRNSLLLESTGGSTEWQPDAPPDGFQAERLPPPAVVQQAVARARATVGGDGDLALALALARSLGDNPRRGGAIRRDTVDTLARIAAPGRGYCADYSQVYNALALGAGLAVREWGWGEGQFGSGHAFNEIWDRQLGKWVLVDAFRSFHVRDRQSGLPLSVTEYHQRLAAGNADTTAEVVPIDLAQFTFAEPAAAHAYYRRGLHHFYVFLGNNVLSLDRDPLVRAAASLSRSASLLAGIVSGVQPAIRVLETSANRADHRALAALRHGLLGALGLGAVLAAYLAASLWAARRRPGAL